MNLRSVSVGAALTVIVLAGCGSPSSGSTPSRTPDDTGRPGGAPSASPEPSGPPPLSCNTIITEQTLAGFEAQGYIHEVDYESEVRSEGSVEELFFDFGGLACKWYLPNSEIWFTAAYSELIDAQSAQAQARLEAEGYMRNAGAEGVTYTIDPNTAEGAHSDTYVFEPKAWFYSNHSEGVAEIRSVVSARD